MVESKSEKNDFPQDRYGGIMIEDMSLLAETEALFQVQLTTLLSSWEEENARSVSIKFRPPKCHLMNVCAEKGFKFHHALDGYVLMVLWMDKTCENRMPSYAHHYVGTGGICFSEDGSSILLVKPRRFRKGQENWWKFPGGFVDPNQSFGDSAVREVYEETGVTADFCGVVGMRELLGFNYGA